MKDGPGIYLVQRRKPGGSVKCYVGSSLRAKNRITQHQQRLAKGKHANAHMQSSYNKYGATAFEWSVIEWCERENRFAREQWWIEFLGTSDPKLGYNKAYPVRASEPHPMSSQNMKDNWKDPAKRALWLGYLAKGSKEVVRRLKEDPEFAAKMSVIRQEMWTDESRKKLSDIAVKRYRDSDYREMHLDSLAKGREKLFKLQEDPAFVERQTANMISQWEKPARRVAQAERMRALWADPEFRAKSTARSLAQIQAVNAKRKKQVDA